MTTRQLTAAQEGAIDPVLHLESKPGRSYCGRNLPTAGFFTDNEAMFEEREGSRCKVCWRVLQCRAEAKAAVAAALS